MASKVNREQNRNHRAAPCRATLRPIVFALMAAFGSIAHGLPTDPKVIAGQATVSTSNPSSMVINQSSGKAAIDWRTFSVAGHESVRFAQPSASAMTVNRVTSNDPSQILGRISAPGSVFLINPAGVLFGKGAVVHVGNLVASTLNANPHDLLAGRLVFTADPAGAGVVRNEGQISTPAGGSVSLIGARVINSGHISTPGGTTGLIAGDKVALDFDGDGLVRYQVDGALARALVEHSGRIDADGGRVVMQARARDALLDTVLNVEGVVRARGVTVRNGEIHLDGGGSGVVSVSGQLDPSTPDVARQGGEVRVLGDRVGLFGQARIDASGAAGGGTVLIGGDYQGQGSERNATQTFVGPEVAITADAGATGDGGKVIVWADDWTRYHGTISAKGGEQGGDGGFVEVSGKRNLTFDGDVVTSAAKGRAGMLLLDPGDLYFSATAVGGATELQGPQVFEVPAHVPPPAQQGDFYVAASRFTLAGTGSATSSYTLKANGHFILKTDASFASAANQTVSITADRGSIKSDPSAGKDFSISTAGADLILTAQSMSLGEVSTVAGSLSGALTINVTGVGQSATQSGVFSGGSLTKLGSGTLELSQANAYTGGTTISAGTLQTNVASVLPNGGAVSVGASGVLDLQGKDQLIGRLSGDGKVDLGGGRLTVDGGDFGGQFVGTTAGHLDKTSGAQLILRNSNTLGSTTIQAGTLTAAKAKALGDGSVTIQDGGTLEIANVALALGSLAKITIDGGTPSTGGGGTLSGTGTQASYAGALELAIPSGSPGATRTNLRADANAVLTLSGEITGGATLHKVGDGEVVLSPSAKNPYGGGTFVKEGKLTVKHEEALGDGSVTIQDGGTLEIANVALALGSLAKITIDGGTPSTGGGGTLSGTGTQASYAGALELAIPSGSPGATRTSLRADTNQVLTLTGEIRGGGTLTKVGAGKVVLGNDTSDYSGGTTVTDGTLATSVASALPASSVLPNGGAVSVGASGVLDLQGKDQWIGRLSGDGKVDLGGGRLTVEGGDFGGQFVGTTAGHLDKTSGAQLILRNSNTLGSTTIQAGTLTAAKAKALGDGS
ncbi:MAG: filamentous hemagglutinin N-terminal domain-containing protein, partial [Candidatus Accumulibacter sp.]|nr:filamentous hemagglutinin N-terminal domain-containing protein [Candidatus Accumulibacter conexus]